ncbi:MAG: calcium-binding protein [Neisseria sp.]|uniref:calcium-binding protein n=1 Tax=Neisseria sp. TaxID=192066 RepID=UPI0026DD0C8D|nr:calcium-binding protein [Neisseria sp.]MDO4640433.1 calcium-binding protein [Neisseria sp.]
MSAYGFKGSFGHCAPRGVPQWNCGQSFAPHNHGWDNGHHKGFGHGHGWGGWGHNDCGYGKEFGHGHGWGHGHAKGFGCAPGWGHDGCGYGKDFGHGHGHGWGGKDWGCNPGYDKHHHDKGGNHGNWCWDDQKGWCHSDPSQNDIVYGTDHNDDISTGPGNDIIISKGGNDILDGESGCDIMIGGPGNDTYYVDNHHDKVIEKAGEGDDTILSSVNITAPNHVENITLLTDHDLNAIGNHLNNVLHGNDGKNFLSSLDGNDNLYGHAGNDILVGGRGNDFLDGGTGNDILNGGEGCDTYVFARGYDHDVIYDFDCDSSHTDILQFNGEIKASDLCFERCGNDLLINIASQAEDGGRTSEDSITVNNWFKGSEYQIEQFVFTESKVTWDAKQIADAVHCYSCGDSDLTASVQDQIQAQSQACCA